MSIVWTGFWLVFAVAVVIWIAKNANTFFSVSSLGLVRKLLWICIGTCAVTFALNWFAIHNGNIPNPMLVWLFQNSLWAVPIVGVARLIQELGINRRANSSR